MPILPDDIELKELANYLLFSHATKEQLTHIRKTKERTYYRRKQKFDKLLAKYKNDSIDISDKVHEKWLELLES